MIAPCAQFVVVVCVWEVFLCVDAGEEEGAEPDVFEVVVVFGNCRVGDCVPKRFYLSYYAREDFLPLSLYEESYLTRLRSEHW